MSYNFRSEKIKQKIMRRVYLIWFFKKITRPFALEIMSFTAISFLLATHISIINVWENSRHMIFSPISISGYMASSFLATEILTKILIVGLALVLGFWARDMARASSRYIFFRKSLIPIGLKSN